MLRWIASAFAVLVASAHLNAQTLAESATSVPAAKSTLGYIEISLTAKGKDGPSVAVAADGTGTESDPFACCPPPGQWWVRAEYLQWWLQGAHLPPLVTASPPGTPVAAAGTLGSPGTTVLFGDSDVLNDTRPGGRWQIGTWLDCDHTCGIQGSFFILGSQSTGTALSSNGSQILARPFINAGNGRPDAELLSFPGALAGSVAVDAGSSNLMGADFLFRKNLCCRTCDRLDFLAGYRFLRYDDHVNIREELQPLGPLFVPGTRLGVEDSFSAHNQFHGAALGLSYQRFHGPWSFEVEARIDLGASVREVNIDGNTTVTVPGAPPVFDKGGLLALSSNIGTFHSTRFAVVPELDLHVGYQLTSNVRFLVGYSYLDWTRLSRAAEQVDLNVNRNLLPPVTPPVTGPARPAFPNTSSDMWIQGLSVGLEVRF
jgi:Putative beta barrel porin-7 (BBP7)